MPIEREHSFLCEQSIVLCGEHSERYTIFIYDYDVSAIKMLIDKIFREWIIKEWQDVHVNQESKCLNKDYWDQSSTSHIRV